MTDEGEMHVDPWTVKNINYDKLIDQFRFRFVFSLIFLSFPFLCLPYPSLGSGVIGLMML